MRPCACWRPSDRQNSGRTNVEVRIKSGWKIVEADQNLEETWGTINIDTVMKIGLTLPGVEESTAYGAPALKVHGKLFACVPTHRSAEPGSLAFRVGFDDRAELLAAAPDVYYVTDHYLNYSAVLVRLSRVTPDVLRDLLGMAHKFVTPDAARRSPSRHPRKPV